MNGEIEKTQQQSNTQQRKREKIWLIYENNILQPLINYTRSEEEANEYYERGYAIEEVEVEYITNRIVRRVDDDSFYYEFIPDRNPLPIIILDKYDVIDEILKDVREEIDYLKYDLTDTKKMLKIDYKIFIKKGKFEEAEEIKKKIEKYEKLLKRLEEIEDEAYGINTVEEALSKKKKLERALEEIRRKITRCTF
jgi:trehalose-6-phosphate synthase